MNVNWKNHIVSTPDVLRGKPRITGTRIPVSLVLKNDWKPLTRTMGLCATVDSYLASGSSHEEIIREFPDLTTQNIMACLDYARELAEFEVAV